MTDLTPAGQERKDDMLASLQGRVTARRRRRRAIQISAGAIPLLAVGVFVLIGSQPIAPPTGPIAGTNPPPIDTASAPTAPVIETVKFARIGDAELLDLLREADRPGGLIRRGSVTTVAFDDPERAAVRPGAG